MTGNRRFRSVYDVDLLGAAVLTLLTLAGWWVVVTPWQQTWRNYERLADLRTEARKGIRDDSAELQRSRKDLARLEHVVAAQVDSTPNTDAIADLLRDMTALAKRTDIELLSVIPQPADAEGIYRVADIKFTGRGQSTHFIKFLDRLAEENPHQSLVSCSITRPPDCTDVPEDAEETLEQQRGVRESTCSLTWIVRLYLLPRDGAWVQATRTPKSGREGASLPRRDGRRNKP